jgi:flagellar biosynthetic protein FliR
MITLALPIAGQIIATQTGLASVLQQDPSLGAQTTAISVCFSLAAPVLVLSTGLYRLPLAALAGSYREIPPGLAFDGAGAAAMVVAATSGAFALALRLASPFVLLAVIWQVALGVAARILPRLQVHFASLPGQVLTGLALLAFGSTVLLAAASDSIRQAWLALPGVL